MAVFEDMVGTPDFSFSAEQPSEAFCLPQHARSIAWARMALPVLAGKAGPWLTGMHNHVTVPAMRASGRHAGAARPGSRHPHLHCPHRRLRVCAAARARIRAGEKPPPFPIPAALPACCFCWCQCRGLWTPILQAAAAGLKLHVCPGAVRGDARARPAADVIHLQRAHQGGVPRGQPRAGAPAWLCTAVPWDAALANHLSFTPLCTTLAGNVALAWLHGKHGRRAA